MALMTAWILIKTMESACIAIPPWAAEAMADIVMLDVSVRTAGKGLVVESAIGGIDEGAKEIAILPLAPDCRFQYLE
jgi:hypothetical protein